MRQGNAGHAWTAEAVARLRQFWDEAHSASEIGRRLGVSKNAVIGKVRRLALPGRPSPIRQGGVSAKGPARQKVVAARRLTAAMPSSRTAVVDARSAEVPPAASAAATIAADPCVRPARESRECCWPIGEPRTAGFRLCGAPARGRAPYCEAHSKSAYVRAQPERSNKGLKQNAAKQG